MSEAITFHLSGEEVGQEPFHYTACGLDNIYLANGFYIEEDQDYGRIVTVHQEDDLLKAIGLRILENPKLSAREFRFLRKQMGLTQEVLAERLDVSVQTVANYEKGATTIPGPSEQGMRFIFLLYLLPEGAKAEVLKTVFSHSPRERRPLPRRERNRIVRSWFESARYAA